MKLRWIAACLVAGWTGAAGAQKLIVADFDSGNRPNNVGGDFGVWHKDAGDPTQGLRDEFDGIHTRQGSGHCLKLTYDVDSTNAAYNGFWMKLESLDARPYSSLVFWAKADPARGCTSRLKVELKTDEGVAASYVDGIAAEWRRFQIPLSEFASLDLSALTEFGVVFEDHTSLPKEGVLYLDDVGFE